jgi:phosphoribosylformylglycinamidine (FGAM) synthase-like enzyme
MAEQPIDFEQVEALGISREAYDEVLDIVGRIPTMEELSTLLAMWESNGRQQSLYGWLRGQRHSVQRDEYLYTGSADHRAIREPRVKDCLDIALQLVVDSEKWVVGSTRGQALPTAHYPLSTGLLLYMVGNVSTEFADSEYARRCLHLVDQPMGAGGHDEDCQYIELILGALAEAGVCSPTLPIGQGGLFCSLLRLVAPLGYDILTPREVRLDAFLFGEERGRYLVALDEGHDDQFLLKMDEARLNCCFLGRTTKGRLLVDGYDFGPVSRYTA